MKLTQREVAEKLNMSDTYYGKIERGECRANLERLAQISVLLNVPLEDLISGCMENAVPSNADNPQKLSLASQFYLWLLGEKPQPYAARMQRHCAD